MPHSFIQRPFFIDLSEVVAVAQSLSLARLFVAHQVLLSSTVSQSLLKAMFIELVMQSNHLILWVVFNLLSPLLSSIFLSIRVFSSE